MLVDELPTGPVVTFFLTTFVSWFFQFPGFILTYLLHGTHAGKYGSQAGLALTLIQFGLGASFTNSEGFPGMGGGDSQGGQGEADENGPSSSLPSDVPSSPAAEDKTMLNSFVGSEWISFFLMTIGMCLLLAQFS